MFQKMGLLEIIGRAILNISPLRILDFILAEVDTFYKIIFVLVAVILSNLTAKIASHKGRNYWIFFVLGLIVPWWIMLIIVLVIRDGGKAKKKDTTLADLAEKERRRKEQENIGNPADEPNEQSLSADDSVESQIYPSETEESTCLIDEAVEETQAEDLFTETTARETYAPIAEVKADPANPDVHPTRKILYCRKCGYRLPEDSIFCSCCGNRIEDPDASDMD